MDLITRTIKRYYEETFINAEQRQFYQTIFPSEDKSTTENFLLDQFIEEIWGVTYRHADTQSNNREHVNGEGKLIKIPRASEKTALSESLMEKVAAGLESTAGFTENEARTIGRIVRSHVAGHLMTKNKQAAEVLLEDEFMAHGETSDLSIKFGRDPLLSMTYDFTQAGATFSEAIAQQLEELRGFGMPLSNVVMLCGQDWLTAYSEDDTITVTERNNFSNLITTNPMTPSLIGGTEGLYSLAQIRRKNMLAPVVLASYAPRAKYRAYKGATGEDFIPSDRAVMLSLDDERWNIMRGIRVKDPITGRSKQVTGDMVMDTFTLEDPTTDFIRSATRHGFVPANTNHIASSTGTF